MKTRIISGAVVAVIMFGALWLGGIWLNLLLLFCALVGLYEFYRAVGLLDKGKYISPLTGIGYVGTICLYILEYVFASEYWIVLFVSVLTLLVILGMYVFSFPKYEVGQIVNAFFGFFYAPVMLSFVFLTRSMEDGIYIVWLIFLSSWFCDVFAYFTGMLLGKHKLAPVLSPKKSIEGAVGGVVFPALFGGLYGYFIKGYISGNFPVAFVFCLICAVGAIVSQIGDLSASAIKRNRNIKDYGTLIPGHGGILDRFDSVIFTSPMIFFIAYIFMKVM